MIFTISSFCVINPEVKPGRVTSVTKLNKTRLSYQVSGAAGQFECDVYYFFQAGSEPRRQRASEIPEYFILDYLK